MCSNGKSIWEFNFFPLIIEFFFFFLGKKLTCQFLPKKWLCIHIKLAFFYISMWSYGYIFIFLYIYGMMMLRDFFLFGNLWCCNHKFVLLLILKEYCNSSAHLFSFLNYMRGCGNFSNLWAMWGRRQTCPFSIPKPIRIRLFF